MKNWLQSPVNARLYNVLHVDWQKKTIKLKGNRNTRGKSGIYLYNPVKSNTTHNSRQVTAKIFMIQELFIYP
ncbi:MAG: hypothetical protein M3218_02580 [Thermoproteota archaeon]|nr:hypothetical protein [Thermoproteota archaeon]